MNVSADYVTSKADEQQNDFYEEEEDDNPFYRNHTTDEGLEDDEGFF